MGRECVEGGVEDRGQVKPKHGAQKKQRPPTFPPSLHTTIANAKGQDQRAKVQSCSDTNNIFCKS